MLSPQGHVLNDGQPIQGVHFLLFSIYSCTSVFKKGNIFQQNFPWTPASPSPSLDTSTVQIFFLEFFVNWQMLTLPPKTSSLSVSVKLSSNCLPLVNFQESLKRTGSWRKRRQALISWQTGDARPSSWLSRTVENPSPSSHLEGTGRC